MRKLILILTICCCAFAAAAENVVSASSASGHPQDEVTLQIALANSDAVVAFQTEIPLGDNLEYVANSVALNADRITDHGVTAAVVGGNLRIFVYSLSLTPFVGDEGTLLSFNLKLKNEPGDYVVDISNSKLSDASGVSIDFNVNNGSVTILSPKIQVNTGTLDYGHVPIQSEYSATASFTNVGNEPLTITAINFNDAVFSCPTFAETTVQPGNSANFTFKFAPMVKGIVNASATIVSNSISGNSVINLVADPFAVNEFHFTNVSGYCDSIVYVPMTVNNMENLIGFQIDVKMPSALEYVGFELSNRKTDHIAVGVVKNDTLRLMAYSPSGSAFTGDDGVIGVLSVRLKGLYGYYWLNPFKAILADASGENVISEKYQGYVNIRSPQIAGNSSLNMGSSPVNETVTEEYIVSNNGNAQMRIDQVVFDQPDWTVAETFPLTVEQYSNTVLHVSYSREQKGDFTAMMKIYSNDPQNGLKNVALSGSRYEPNTLSIEADPFILDEHNVALEISMDNYSDIVALQADFEYPYEDYSVAASDFQLTERFANHTLYAMPVGESMFKILVFSLQNANVEGNDGVILNVTLHPIGEPIDQDYTVSLSNIVISGADGVNIFSGSEVSDTFALTVTQATPLVTGWNWYSTYIEQSGINGLAQLESSIDEYGTIIKLNSAYVMNRGTSWIGSLKAIDNARGYKINVTAPSEAQMHGAVAKVAEHPITIKNKWNWIGYPVRGQQNVTTALAGFTPQNGDILKGQSGFTTYRFNRWMPADFTLVPGRMYLYYSTSTEDKTLVFANSKTSNMVGVDGSYYWNANVGGYPDNICVMAVVSVDGIEQRSEDIELAAFVNGECRGNCKLIYVGELNRYFALLTITGEDGEVVSFGIMTEGKAYLDCETNLTFRNDDVIGSFENPLQLSFGENHATDITLFPNPVGRNDAISMILPKDETVKEVVITNILGGIVRRDVTSNTTLAGIATSGVYNVQIITAEGNIYRGKVIVR